MAPNTIGTLSMVIIHQVRSHTDCDTTGEGYDYRMKEENKAFKETIDYWKIRELEYLNCHLVNACGDRLSSDSVMLIETCQKLKKKCINNILSNENFVTAPNPKKTCLHCLVFVICY